MLRRQRSSSFSEVILVSLCTRMSHWTMCTLTVSKKLPVLLSTSKVASTKF